MNPANLKTAIIIPARYGSTRLPGKPLAMLGGKTMLARVVEIARAAAQKFENTHVLVATEDRRIMDHAALLNVACVPTDADCPTGSDRALQAAQKSGQDFDFIVNLQGDAPFTPPEAIENIIAAFQKNPGASVVTPVYQLRWAQLDQLREHKKTTPFSGTTVIIDAQGRALWFSKTIIPALRNENALRAASEFSPVYQHIGLYGYSRQALETFCALPQGAYETLEGLEQLRFIENGMDVQTVQIQADFIHSGIDSPEDLQRAQTYFAS